MLCKWFTQINENILLEKAKIFSRVSVVCQQDSEEASRITACVNTVITTCKREMKLIK